MNSKSLGFIGGGRTTKILLQAFKNIGFKKIVAYDTNSDTWNDGNFMARTPTCPIRLKISVSL
jgi:hypothetical protein